MQRKVPGRFGGPCQLRQIGSEGAHEPEGDLSWAPSEQLAEQRRARGRVLAQQAKAMAMAVARRADGSVPVTDGQHRADPALLFLAQNL